MARTMRMLSEAELADALSLGKLLLPPEPHVKEILVEEREDWEGEPILEVYAILNDDAPDEDFRWDRVRPISETIRDALRGAGESRFAMFTPMTREMFDRRYSFDPDADDE